MSSHPLIAARVTPELKHRVQQVAKQQLLTESIWLRQLVDAALRDVGSTSLSKQGPARRMSAATRIQVRLRADDQILLRERAAARGMPAATYVSVLTRSHLRRLTPLPKPELQALKRSVAELTAVGRNLNQIARAINASGNTGAAVLIDDLRSFLKVSQGLRDHVKALIKANITSWEDGHVSVDD